MAEQDMEIIRSKRASSNAAGAAASGQPKSKYRKRSVSSFSFFSFPQLLIRSLSPFFGPDSGLPLQENATRAIFARPPNGEEGLMVLGPCVMPVVCVRVSCTVTAEMLTEDIQTTLN